MLSERQAVGRRAEKAAERFLKRRGMRLVARNFSCPVGEVDLVFREGETYVFVEVRALGPRAAVSPRDTVGAKKRRRISRVADAFLASQRLRDIDVRFDIVEVYLDERQRPRRIEHFPDAFGDRGEV